MIRNILQRITLAKDYLKQAFKQKNIFQLYENRAYTNEQIIKAVRFALASNATDYKHFIHISHYLSAIIYYLVGGEKNEQVQQLLALEEEALWITPKYVLYMFQKYLERVMPTNIAYYHFMREEEFLTQYAAIKYILVVGFYHLQNKEHILLKMKTNQKLQLFTLLLDWLLTLVYYRCSAIYIKSNCVDPLVYQAHLLLSVVLGYDGHSILSSLTEIEVTDIVNKMFYIEAFLLAMAIPTKNYLSIHAVINSMRKLLTSAPQQKIFMYFPSYLYSNLIGFIKNPYTTEIIYRLLIFFISQHDSKNQVSESGQALIAQQCLAKEKLITQCWSILCLLVEQYDLNKNAIKDLILHKVSRVQSKSMDRSFILRIANNQHLDLQDDKIRKFINSRNQPYVVSNKVIKPDLFVKNYHISMQNYYLKTIIEASKGKWLKIDPRQIWELILLYNKYEITSLDDYLLQVKMSKRDETS